jgi:nitrogenase iron protein NifH
LIQEAELDAKTVVEKYPESDEAQEYFDLASSIMDNENVSTPEPMSDDEFEEFFRSYL